LRKMTTMEAYNEQLLVGMPYLVWYLALGT
jgi:hypothetical protein